MGTSQSEYLATANKMGALFQGSGLTQQQSLEGIAPEAAEPAEAVYPAVGDAEQDAQQQRADRRHQFT